jgi:hypothetical protein
MQGRTFRDTTNFFSIDYGDVIEIGGMRLLVRGHAREWRFGLDEPKFWVKNVVDEATGSRKIVKLAFEEVFETSLGGRRVRRFRSPEKEAEILGFVGDHPSFMHGRAVRDAAGNVVRVLDIIRGTTLYQHLEGIAGDHEAYFHETLPGVLERLVEAIAAIGMLHRSGFRHGDIRNDHLFVEDGTGRYRWIDFDYDYEPGQDPWVIDVYGLGNILIHSVGKGFHDVGRIRSSPEVYGDLGDHVTPADVSILERRRFINLRKLFPYVPERLNALLLRFSAGSERPIRDVDELLDALGDVREG